MVGAIPPAGESNVTPSRCASYVVATATKELCGAWAAQQATDARWVELSGAHGLDLPGGQQSSIWDVDAHAQPGARPIMAMHSSRTESARRVMKPV
jgi:hypothetical protein